MSVCELLLLCSQCIVIFLLFSSACCVRHFAKLCFVNTLQQKEQKSSLLLLFPVCCPEDRTSKLQKHCILWWDAENKEVGRQHLPGEFKDIFHSQ